MAQHNEDESICLGISSSERNLLLRTKSVPFKKPVKVSDLEEALYSYSQANTNPDKNRVIYNTCGDLLELRGNGTEYNPFVVTKDKEVESQTVFCLEPDTDVQLDLVEVLPTVRNGKSLKDGEDCLCVKYKNQFDGNWKFTRFGQNLEKSVENQPNLDTDQIKIYDFTKFQQQNELKPKPFPIDRPGVVFHMLRSILRSDGCNSHLNSPWCAAYAKDRANGDQNKTKKRQYPVGILLRHTHIDQELIKEFFRFRTSDASPGYAFHSALELSFSADTAPFNQLKSSLLLKRKLVQGNEVGSLLMIYREIPPRDQFSSIAPSCNQVASETDEYFSYLWETHIKPEESHLSYRKVASPYHDIDTLYPDLKIQSSFATPANLEIITKEAFSIPQWTAWPEKSHYRPVSKNYDENGDPIWSVFPLVHTFPARDLSKRLFLDKLLQFVPKTAALLKEHFGDTLRTALFSRLQPETTLGTHTGWMDLANHVLRLHIPLKVPKGTYCGTWVDGCVELQRVGKVICFDDSKLHRAFNYSEEERIVLILDVLRHSNGDEIEDLDAVGEGRKLIPEGTSTDGHSNELDDFIKSQGFL